MAETPHFIDPNSPIAVVLDTILEIAGSNFVGPYTSSTQPHDIVAANQESLIQYGLPGGSVLSGNANPAYGGNIGAAINSMLGLLAPVISAYAFILPILGVIRGIIEILCCLMNPFCVIPAVIRLFKKWIPPFIALFPPLAAVIFIISTIKAILAIIFYILTEIVPIIQLIIENIRNMSQAFKNPEDLSDSQIEAVKVKLDSIIKTLIQKTGIMAVFLPLLELIFLILGLVSGFPCKGGKSDRENASTTTISPTTISYGLESDSGCCDDLCPDELGSRDSAPSGTGVVVESEYCEYAPVFVYSVLTGDTRVANYEGFQESREDQLNGCLDEEIKYARPAGSDGDRSLIKIRLSNRRGVAATFPALLIDGTTVKFVSPIGSLFKGVVNWELQPDYDLMVMEGIIGAGCHPDVQDVKNGLATKFGLLENSGIENNPEAATLLDDALAFQSMLDEQYGVIRAAVDEIIDVTDPPFDDQLLRIEGARDTIVQESNDYINDLTGDLNKIINRNSDASASTFEVSKETVVADASDTATITVYVRDLAGALLLKNIPSGVAVNVELLTDVGEIFEQELKTSSGAIEAKIKSPIVGTANITAKINGDLISDFDGVTETTRVRVVQFVSDAALPTRRRRSKPSVNSKINTGTNSERSPGNN